MVKCTKEADGCTSALTHTVTTGGLLGYPFLEIITVSWFSSINIAVPDISGRVRVTVPRKTESVCICFCAHISRAVDKSLWR